MTDTLVTNYAAIELATAQQQQQHTNNQRPVGGVDEDEEPSEWTMLQLDWRDLKLKNDYDREKWLGKKYNVPNPHTNEGRKALYRILSSKIKSRWGIDQTIRWALGCCGSSTRCCPVLRDNIMWVVLLLLYTSVWVGFFTQLYNRSFPYNPTDPTLTWDDGVRLFRNAIIFTCVITGITAVVYEVPRAYEHCFKCRLYPVKDAVSRIPVNTYYSCGSCMCFMYSKASRLRRARYEDIIRADKRKNPEAATHAFLYDEDIDDPDEFIYYHHLPHTNQTTTTNNNIKNNKNKVENNDEDDDEEKKLVTATTVVNNTGSVPFRNSFVQQRVHNRYTPRRLGV